MRTLFLFFSLLLLMASAGASAGPHDEATYHNIRFGQIVTYPRDIFPHPSPPPGNGDGQIFTSQDGQSTLSAAGRWNIDDFATIDKILAEAADFRAQDGWTVTYRKIGVNWGVISGVKAERIFYEKLLLTHHKKIINTLAIEYPTTAKPIIDPVIPRIAASFREGVAASED